MAAVGALMFPLLRQWRKPVAAVCLIATTTTAVAQQKPDNWPRVLLDGQPTRIERAEIPRILQDAVDSHRNCRLEDSLLHDLPIIIFQPARSYRPMALVPCSAILPYSVAFLFERGITNRPTLMAFPIVARTGGFTTSTMPGLLTWEPSTKTLVAFRGNDLSSGAVHRHTYRHIGNDSEGLNGFALLKFEHGNRTAGGVEHWHALWEAQPWVVPDR
jgi:hypothetical protein